MQTWVSLCFSSVQFHCLEFTNNMSDLEIPFPVVCTGSFLVQVHADKLVSIKCHKNVTFDITDLCM